MPNKTRISEAAKHMSERELEDAVIDTAHTFGWMVAHFRSVEVKRKDGSTHWATPMKGDRGFPDLVLARNGVVLFVELKTQKGRQSGWQAAWESAMNDRMIKVDGEGALIHLDYYHLWRPTDWLNDTIVETLR